MFIRESGKAIVTATGAHTELGKIQQMGINVDQEITPLEKKLHHLSTRLIWLTLILASAITITGYIRGVDFVLMLETGIALAVASIPEGLLIVATIALARGMLRLSKKQVIIKKLEAVHTLGATNIICTDKTGTLTEDQMKVNTIVFDTASFQNVYPNNQEALKSLKDLDAFEKMMMASILCNNVNLTNKERHGDPVELALIEFAEYADYDPVSVQKNNPKELEKAFDSESKMMATINRHENKFNVHAKGAFESIAEFFDYILKNGKKKKFEIKKEWEQKSER